MQPADTTQSTPMRLYAYRVLAIAAFVSLAMWTSADDVRILRPFCLVVPRHALD